MTKQEQYDFVQTLIAGIEKSILEKLAQAPEEWDGHELRQYIADKFTDLAGPFLIKREPRSRRSREYRNAVLVNSL